MEAKTLPLELTEEDKKAHHQALFKILPILAPASLIFMSLSGAIFIYAVNTDEEKLSQLKSFGNKLEFTVKHFGMGSLWLVLCVLRVIYGRVAARAINPLDNKNRDVQFKGPAMILQNSLEQFTISCVAQISLTAYIPSWALVKVIPWINFLFIVGRVSFAIGYPKYRGFGILLSLLPNLAMSCFIALSLIRFTFSI